MKYGRLVTALAIVSLVTVGGFARQAQGGNGPNGGAGPMGGNTPAGEMANAQGHQQGPMGGNGPGGMMHEFSDFNVVFDLAGVPVIMEKYNIMIDKEMLNAREKKLTLIDQRRQLHDQIVTLVNSYSGSADQQAKIVDLIKQINKVQNQIEDINVATMDRIRQLNNDRRSEVNTAVEKWIKTIQTDPAAFQKFIDAMRNRPRMDPDNDNR